LALVGLAAPFFDAAFVGCRGLVELAYAGSVMGLDPVALP
jgi:hypothetical protein